MMVMVILTPAGIIRVAVVVVVFILNVAGPSSRGLEVLFTGVGGHGHHLGSGVRHVVMRRVTLAEVLILLLRLLLLRLEVFLLLLLRLSIGQWGPVGYRELAVTTYGAVSRQWTAREGVCWN